MHLSRISLPDRVAGLQVLAKAVLWHTIGKPYSVAALTGFQCSLLLAEVIRGQKESLGLPDFLIEVGGEAGGDVVVMMELGLLCLLLVVLGQVLDYHVRSGVFS